MKGVSAEEIRQPLTRERICEAALEVIDRDGLEAVSMRNLARSLGVQASSLYYHFENKDALLVGVADTIYGVIGRIPSQGECENRLKTAFLELRDFIQSHPNVAALLARDLAHSALARNRAASLVELLFEAGYDPQTSIMLVGNLVAFLVGHSLLIVWINEELNKPLASSSGRGDGNHGEDGNALRGHNWIRSFLQSVPAVSLQEGVLSADSNASLACLAESLVLTSFETGLDALIGEVARTSDRPVA